MLLKKFLICISLILILTLSACISEPADTYLIYFYDVNENIIHSYDYDLGDNFEDLEYPEPETVDGYQFITWSVPRSELELNKNYEIYPIYSRTLTHENANGYEPRVVSSKTHILVFLIDSINPNLIQKIQIYKKNDIEYYQEIIPEGRYWGSPDSTFQIYDNKIIIPAILRSDNARILDIYDINNPNFHIEIDIQMEEYADFSEQIFVVHQDHIIVETSLETQTENKRFLDLYSLNTYDYQGRILEYDSEVRIFDASFIATDGGGLHTLEDRLIIGKVDYLVSGYLPVILSYEDYSVIKTLEKPDVLGEYDVPYLLEVGYPYMFTKYITAGENPYEDTTYVVNHLEDDSFEYILYLDEYAKYLEVIEDYAFFISRQANALYIANIIDDSVVKIEKNEEVEYIFFSNAVLVEDELIITYYNSEFDISQRTYTNFVASSVNEYTEQKLIPAINGNTEIFLSQAYMFNQKLYAIATDESSLYLLVYSMGELVPEDVILLEDTRFNAFKGLDLIEDELIIYLRDKTFVIKLY